MTSFQRKKRVAAVTLGCKLNYAETSSILEQLVGRGWQIAAPDETPDLVIVHTCAVTNRARQKSRQQIRKMIHNYPHSRIAVTGCCAQLSPDSIATINGVDAILGNEEKFLISNYTSAPKNTLYRAISSPGTFQSAVPAHSRISDTSEERTRAFLKVQDGCDYRCVYCVIPHARGKSRSVPLADVLAGAARLAEAGYHEIVLTGVNVADYRSGEATLAELLGELDAIEIDRLRISSIEPDRLDKRLITTVASSPKLMPHFHLPLQSGSDAILTAMRRRYTSSEYRERLLEAVETIPDCAVGADVIVGYPGETEDDFMATYHLLENLPLAYLHVFPCSLQRGTELAKQVSAGMHEKVLADLTKSRVRTLLDLAEKKQREYSSQYLGKSLPVLFEKHKTNRDGRAVVSGYSRNYLRVNLAVQNPAKALELVGKECMVVIENINDDLNLEGRIVN